MADYEYYADNVMEEEIEFSTLISPFGNGYDERRSLWVNSLHRFTLKHSRIPLSEKNGIESFFESKKGAYGSFTWVNPNNSTEYTVRFEKDTLKITRLAFDVYDIQVSFKEVRT